MIQIFPAISDDEDDELIKFREKFKEFTLKLH